ncbi:MAG: type II secretion system protein [Pseudomonadales bacterium]|nr:type II secretion system protein [Candidatus Woesebacteria bacterium]MCB9801154.1 type II secretion system protein [Pseudomonadales bacterium]
MKLSKRLNSFLASAKSAAGFTMIELLIVISILGILAVAVLSAINPVEQINRGRDTGSRSDAEQLLSAIDRFNAFQGYFPWVYRPTDDHTLENTSNPDEPPFVTVDNSWYAYDDGTVTDCPVLTRLGSGDTTTVDTCTGALEVKESFTTRISDENSTPLYIYNSGDQGASTYVCFTPQSAAFVQEAEARCGDAAGTGNGVGPGLPDDMADIAAQVCGGYGTEPTQMMVCLP